MFGVRNLLKAKKVLMRNDLDSSQHHLRIEKLVVQNTCHLTSYIVSIEGPEKVISRMIVFGISHHLVNRFDKCYKYA